MISLVQFYMVLLIITATFFNQVDALLKKYASLISDVHEYYGTSSVFFIFSSNDKHLQEITLVHLLSREFSRKGVVTLIINFEELDERANFYRKQIVRPLIVVLLTSESDIHEFNENTEEMNISYPIWLVIFANEFGAPICEYCESSVGNIFDVRFNTEMLVVCCGNPILKEWWSVQKNITEMANFGIWHENKGFIVLTDKGLYARRNNINGSSIRLAIVTSSAFLHDYGHRIGGFFGSVVMELRRVMNFTVSLVLKDDTYGSWSPKTHSWSGVVGMVAEGHADIGVAEFTMTNSRLNVIDFTLPLSVSRNRLYIRQPDGSGVQWSAYFEAFTFEIWITIISIMITTPILLTLIKTKSGVNALSDLIFENYLYVWGIFCQQGLSEFPADTPLRIAYFSIFVSALVVSAAYSASLISYLTVSSASLPFTTFEGFVADGSYKLIVFQNSSDYDLFASSNKTVLQNMMKLMKPWQYLPSTLEDGFRQVCEEKVAFYTTEAMKKTMNMFLRCKVDHIESGGTDSLAMIMPANSQYTGVVNYHIQRFQDNGMMNRFKQKYFTKANPSETTHTIVTLWGVAPILSVLAGGIIVAIIVLISENIYSSFKNCTRKINSRKPKVYRWFKFRSNNRRLQTDLQLPVEWRVESLKNFGMRYYP